MISPHPRLGALMYMYMEVIITVWRDLRVIRQCFLTLACPRLQMETNYRSVHRMINELSESMYD